MASAWSGYGQREEQGYRGWLLHIGQWYPLFLSPYRLEGERESGGSAAREGMVCCDAMILCQMCCAGCVWLLQ